MLYTRRRKRNLRIMSTIKLSPSDVIARSLADAFIKQIRENETLIQDPVKQGARMFEMPHNMNGYVYKNQNNCAILLLHNMMNPNYGGSYATRKQITDLGGTIKRGEYIKSIPIESNFLMYVDEKGKSHYYPYNKPEKVQEIKQKQLRTFWSRRFRAVYNVKGQTEGLAPKYYAEPEPGELLAAETKKKVEALVKLHGIEVMNQRKTPCYNHLRDDITMPNPHRLC